MNYSEEIINILKNSEKEATKNNSEFITTEHILLSILKSNTQSQTIFNKHNINYEEAKKLINNTNSKNKSKYYTLTTKKIIENSFINTKDNKTEINSINLSLSILDDKSCKANAIIAKLTDSYNSLYKDFTKELINNENSILEELGTNINELVINNETDKVIGREEEINRIIEILARKNKNNPILIGEAGVGKTAIVEELARKIVDKNVPETFLNKKIISINLASIISGTKYRGEFEEKMSKIIKELEKNDQIILFIDEIHTIVGAGGAEGAIDASNILKPMLARGKAKCIGATTINEYKKTIEKDKALDRRFQKVYINEPNEAELLTILKKIKHEYEKYHKVKIPEQIIKQIPYLSKKYIHGRSEPDKSIDILDEVCAKTALFFNTEEKQKINNKINKLNKQKNTLLRKQKYADAITISEEINNLTENLTKLNNHEKKIVTEEILKSVLEKKSNSIIHELNNNLDYINNIKQKIMSKIIGQDTQISEIITIYKNHQTKNNDLPTPILIEGKTGTGKTELIKLLSKYTKTNLIKINMNEYKNETSLNRLLGSPQGYVGYNDTNTTFEELKLNSNSIILVENINNTHYSIKDLFKSIIEDGEIKNTKNERINFKNNIIIFTNTTDDENTKIGFIKKQNEEVENYLKIDNYIKMNNLTKNDIYKIINLYSKNLEKTDIEKIITESNYLLQGANKIKQLTDKYKNKVLTKIS